jgi:hypothetical protein
MEDAVEEHILSGFDDASEPQVRRTAEGRLWLGIEFLPPSWAPDEDDEHPIWNKQNPWADFDKRLARAIEVPVKWVDREWFRIDHPRPDTVQAIHRFLLAEKQRFIAEQGCRDPIFAEVTRLYGALRRWKQGATLTQAGGIGCASPQDESAVANPSSANEIARMKARLRCLSPSSHFRIFPEEGWPKAEPGSDPASGPAFSPSWRTATAVALARHIDASSDFSAMPILADALQDAGCESADVLNHCRCPGPHVRGCWVVSLVLGKD